MKKSLAKNSIFYFLYTVCNLLFPFITSIYVARILLPADLGEIAYAQNIVNYFSVLAFLGLPTYGLREISAARNNKEELSKIYSELFTINFVSTIIFSILYYGMVFASNYFYQNFVLYCIIGLIVVVNMFNISWLYEGLEEFGYISLRNAAFKIVMLVFVVLFVINEDDSVQYAAIIVFGIAGNGIINIIYSRNFVKYSIKDLDIKRHLKPVFMLMTVNLAIEIYSMVDITMIGYMSTKEHVAFYSYATRVNKVILQVTNTFTVILVPRISLYYKEGNMDGVNHLLTQGLKIIVLLSLPIIIFMEFTSRFSFPSLFGSEYIISAFVEQILCLLILISPIGYLLGSRVMLISHNEKKMMMCVCIGAILNVFFNFLLIPVLCEVGAAISSVISEVVIMVIYVRLGRKVYNLKTYDDTIKKAFIAAIPVLLLQIAYLYSLNDSWGIFVLDLIVSSMTYFATLIALKEGVCITYYDIAKNKFIRGFAK